MKKAYFMFGMIVVFCLSLTAFGQDIVDHPEKLTFPELVFEPPHPSDFRTTLSNGMVVYIAEDKELPLINVTVLIRGGAAWEPAEKAGLASLVGTMMRDGGRRTAHLMRLTMRSISSQRISTRRSAIRRAQRT
jgi:hypothetical protein